MSFIFLFLAVMIGIGLISCFKGQKIFSILLTLYAFLITYRFVTRVLVNDPNVVIIALVVAVIVALLAQYAKKLAFFLLGFFIGLIIGNAVIGYLPLSDQMTRTIVIIGCGIVLGIVVMHWNKTFIRIGTSYLGGDLIGTAGLFLVFNYAKLGSYVNPDTITELSSLSNTLFTSFASQYSLYILIIALIFTVIGTHYQTHHH